MVDFYTLSSIGPTQDTISRPLIGLLGEEWGLRVIASGTSIDVWR